MLETFASYRGNPAQLLWLGVSSLWACLVVVLYGTVYLYLYQHVRARHGSRSGGVEMITIATLAKGIKQVNQAFIESPELDLDQYRALISEYLIEELMDALLLASGIRDEYPGLQHFGFYSDPKVGYLGYVQVGDEALFFAPTKAVVLKRS